MNIPLVDFAPFLLNHSSVNDDAYLAQIEVAKQVVKAFKEVGFVYLKNYTSLVEKSKEIFELVSFLLG